MLPKVRGGVRESNQDPDLLLYQATEWHCLVMVAQGMSRFGKCFDVKAPPVSPMTPFCYELLWSNRVYLAIRAAKSINRLWMSRFITHCFCALENLETSKENCYPVCANTTGQFLISCKFRSMLRLFHKDEGLQEVVAYMPSAQIYKSLVQWQPAIHSTALGLQWWKIIAACFLVTTVFSKMYL